MKLQGKVAIITGGSRGIGYSVAKAFVSQGASIALCGSKIQSAKEAADKLSAQYPDASILPVGVNLQQIGSVKAMAQAVISVFGKVDILVNNAGITSSKSVFELSDEEFMQVIDINLGGTFRCISQVAPHMKERGGSIINTSSLVGTYGGSMQSAYASSKFGVNGLTKSCAKELGVFGIRVNAVSPGVVSTDMVKQYVTDQVRSALQNATPLGRIADPDELVGAYVYLASDDSSFTTGSILAVDGGLVR